MEDCSREPQKSATTEPAAGGIREALWRIIFLSDTPKGKAFDVALLWLIAASVLVVMLESVDEYQEKYGWWFYRIEWVFTIIFTIEYALRLWVVRRKRRYATSFFGIVDLLSIVPTYLTLFLPGAQYFIALRVLRLMRIFRVLKMARHYSEANVLLRAVKSSLPKITVFVVFVLMIVLILGTLMYVVEGVIAGNEGFSSVPQSVYWGIVTISTVGYGDITPITPAGKMVSTVIILIGYGILAVPTGIVTAELNMSLRQIRLDQRECGECGHVGHDPRSRFCKMCGTPL